MSMRERGGGQGVCVCVWCVGGRETVGKEEREQGVRSWYILRVFFFIRTRMYVESRKWRRRIKAKEEKTECPEMSRRSLLNINEQNNSSRRRALTAPRNRKFSFDRCICLAI